jgi:CRP-like cAMP-binding protein/CheY-like chemotaxis protein
MIQIGKILKKVPIFRMLGKESIDFIVERLKFRTMVDSEVICKVGDPGDEMFIIISGKVKICIYNEESRNEQVVANLSTGDYFGEMALLTGEPRSASVIATEDTEMFVLQKNDFDVILEKFPSISLSMGKIVSQRLRETLKKASQLSKIQPMDSLQTGPTGFLKDVPLVDLIAFCEANSVTGTMELINGVKKGMFEFESGQLGSVKLGDVSDDKALDEMLKWQDGRFEIRTRPLTLKKSAATEKEEIRRILVVNNSLVVRKVIERAFKGLGYDVHTAQNIATAIVEIQKSVPDVIVSDIKLPDGSGLDLVNRARETSPIPFIFITDNNVKSEFENKLRELGKAELTRTHEVSEIVKLVENFI